MIKLIKRIIMDVKCIYLERKIKETGQTIESLEDDIKEMEAQLEAGRAWLEEEIDKRQKMIELYVRMN